RMLQGARVFLGRLEDLQKDQTDRRSRRALARAYEDLAALTDKIGSQTDALGLQRRGLAIRRGRGRDRPAASDAPAEGVRYALALGPLQFRTGHADDALAAYEEARTLLRRAQPFAGGPGDLRTELATCDHLTGELIAATGRPDRAMGWFRRARSIRLSQEREA